MTLETGEITLSVDALISSHGMRLSKQALAFLKYLHDEGATYDNESPDSYGSIRGFLLAESEEHFELGARGEKVVKRGSRYNSAHRIVLKLYRNGYVIRRTHGGARVLGYEYKITEKGLEALQERGIIEKA